jgi:Cdc6-like AAA superfamily ATPase
MHARKKKKQIRGFNVPNLLIEGSHGVGKNIFVRMLLNKLLDKNNIEVM